MRGETTFGNVGVSFHDAEKEITSSNFANVFMPEALVPGAPIDFSELRVKNESNTDIYTLLEFTATITNPDSSQVETYTSWYNLAGEKVNISNIDKDASKILKGSSGQAETLTYQVPVEIDNTYKNGKLKIDITTHAIQGRFGESQGNEPLYASFLILKDNTSGEITSPVVDLTLVIDDLTQTYRVKKNSTLQNAILETNTTANEYNSCGWFDDNEFLECTDLTKYASDSMTLYTKMSTDNSLLCFKKNASSESYSVGLRLSDGTTYINSNEDYDRSKSSVDTSIAGDIVLPCRYINSVGLDWPVKVVHKLINSINNEYGGAFSFVSKITGVTFSSSIVNVEVKTFCYSDIESISIHNKMNNCNTWMFVTSRIKQYKVSPNNTKFSTLMDGKLFTDKTQTKLFTCNVTDLILPEGLLSIDGLLQVRKLTICKSLQSIGSWSFSAAGLTELIIPRDSDLRKIGFDVFNGNSNISSIYIPSKVEDIENDAFRSNVTNLKTVTVDSPVIYKKLTGLSGTDCGGLIRYATTINILSSIDDGTNTFLGDTTKYTKTTTTIDGYSYNQYKKVA